MCIRSRCGGRCPSSSSMRTTRPAARPPHPFFQFRAYPFDMLAPCLVFLHRDGPTDPLVAREWREVFPSRQCLRVGREGVSEISWKVVHDSLGDSIGCHRFISRAHDQESGPPGQRGCRAHGERMFFYHRVRRCCFLSYYWLDGDSPARYAALRCCGQEQEEGAGMRSPVSCKEGCLELGDRCSSETDLRA